MMYLIGLLLGFIILIALVNIDSKLTYKKEVKEEQERIDKENNIVINIGDDLKITYDGKISIYTLNKLFNLQPSYKFFMDGYIDQTFRSYAIQGVYKSYTYVFENTPVDSSSRMLDKEDVIMLFLNIEGYEDEKKYVLDEINKKIEEEKKKEDDFYNNRKQLIDNTIKELDSKFNEYDIKELKIKLKL
jgi:hypothetical protein